MKRLNRRNVLTIIGAAAAAAGLSRPTSADSLDSDEGPRRRFVLIHGAWHGGFAWDGVASRLRKAGHEVETPTLPGMNPDDNRAGIEFSDYVDAVVDVLRRQPKPVILVGHSSAGMLLQAAAPRAADAVRLLVFSSAFVMGDGQNQLDNIPPDAAAALTALSQTTPDGTIPVGPIDGFIRGALMEGDPVATQDALIQRLLPQPFSLLSGRVDTKPFQALNVAKSVLFCVRDHSADYMVQATRLEDYHVVTANGSHEMLFSDPAGYTKALLKLVSFQRSDD